MLAMHIFANHAYAESVNFGGFKFHLYQRLFKGIVVGTNTAANCPEVSLKQSSGFVISNFKQLPWAEVSRSAFMPPPPHLPTSQLARIHVVWTWNYTYCRNVDMKRMKWTHLNIFVVCRKEKCKDVILGTGRNIHLSILTIFPGFCLHYYLSVCASSSTEGGGVSSQVISAA